MNLDKDVNDYACQLCQVTENFLDKVCMDNMLATLIMLCKTIGDVKNIKPKDFRRKLRDIIDVKVQ